ncbi:MAG TPA: sigma 54-interacting transcriptional regulator [Planctomycetota bacterium]|jgi:transcriptional regulator with GAF, ATPase, and Fis domain|nr:sigma 54-interacting transcriptional regulator [Planctomycetota bacterium]
MPRLIVTGPDGQEQVFEFEAGVVRIGRAEDNSVVVDDPAVEPEHCVIEPQPDGRYKLIDLETQAGTEVNGRKVNVHLLEDRDRIYVGDVSILFEHGSAAGEPSRPPRFRVVRRRGRRILQKRVPAAPRTAAPELALDQLRAVLADLAARGGTEALDAARETLEQLYQEHAGEPLYEALLLERENLYRMLEINKLLNSEHNLKKLLELIMDSVIELTGAERGFLILREQDSLVIKVARNFDRESIRKPEFKVSHSVAEEVLRTGRPLLSADALSDPGLPAAGSVTELQLRSLLCVPLRIRDSVLGCVYIDNRFETGLFRESELPLLQGFADQAAIAIENARLFEENLRRQEELRRQGEEIARLNALLKEKVEKQYVELSKVKQDLLSSRRDVPLRHDFSTIVGQSRALKEVFALLDKVIDTDEPVLIHGESGTGKELVARAIHFNSPRARAGRFVSENCSAIPDTLLESELFGHEKGAFTGAVASKPGLFELAHRGTLFLDEIGDMSLDMQKKLLRALQEGEIRRVGGKDVLKVDVRLISASNKDLADLIRAGRFREDLYYRLNVVKITLPPLRDRREDIPLLVEHFLEKIARETGQPRKRVDEVAFWYLRAYSWPGNVRELENEIRRAVALSEDVITVDALKEEIRSQELFRPAARLPSPGRLKDAVREAVEEVERKVIARTLQECGWKKAEAARLLGISRPTLDAKIEAYGLGPTGGV